LRHDMCLGRFGFVSYGMTADQGWLHSNITPSDGSLARERVEYIQTLDPLVLFGDWRTQFEKITVLPNERSDDRLLHVVKLEQGTTHRTVRIDSERGFIVGETVSVIAPPLGRINQEIHNGDFQAVAGHSIVLPMKSTTENPILGTMEVKLLSVNINTPVDQAIFTYPGE
jgi:hypothetical protein